MLRREFREASLLANGVPAAVLEPSSQTQVDLTAAAAAADRRPAVVPDHQLQRPAVVDHHSSGGSSSADSRAAETAYAYGNQSEYTADVNKHGYKTAAVVVKSAAVSSFASAAAAATTTANNNNNDDEYLAEQRLLGNGTDGRNVGAGDASRPPIVSDDYCSRDEDERMVAPNPT